MQTLVVGYLVSFALWCVLAYGALRGTLKLLENKVITDRWLLVGPYLFASLVFYGIRYRFSLWMLDRQAVHELFSIGAYARGDLYAFVLCLPLFYAISVLRPQWVLRVWVNVPLLLLFPFVVKLVLFASGLAPWELHGARVMPTRVE